MVLIAMIDDATSRIAAKFYAAGTVEAHLSLLGEWLRAYGRPVAVYTDRHSIFEPQDKGKALPDGVTQFGRALVELDVELIRAHSPQAEGAGRAAVRHPAGPVGQGTAAGEGGDHRPGQRPARSAGAGAQPAVRAAAATGGGPAPAAGPGTPAGVNPVGAGRAGGEQRLRGAVREPPLPTAQAGLPRERGGRVVLERRLDGALAIRFPGTTWRIEN
jgi:hypothetical protein